MMTRRSVIKAQEANIPSFADLYAKYNPMLLGEARKILKHQEDSEDAAASAWVSVLEKFSQFQGTIKQMESWLRTITRNKSKKIYTQKRARVAHEGEGTFAYSKHEWDTIKPTARASFMELEECYNGKPSNS